MALRQFHRVVPIPLGLCLALSYFLLASASLRFTRYDGGAAFVWIAGPMLFAALTVAPRRKRLALALWCVPGMALAGSLFGLGWKVAAPFSILNIGEAFAAAWVVRRVFPRFGQFQSAREIFWFVLAGGLAVPAVVALGGALLVHLATHAPYGAIWRDWFTAHAVGLIAFGPPLTLMLGGQMKKWAREAGRQRLAEACAIMLLVAASAIATFGQSKVPLLAVPFLPMMLATLRIGRFGAISSIVILIAIGSGFSLAGIGPTLLIGGGMGFRMQVLQVYFATVVLVILPTAAELKARRRMFERLQAAEAMNRLMLDHSSDIIVRLGLDGIVRYVSPSIRRYDGMSPEVMTGHTLEALVHSEDRERVAASHRAAVASPRDIVRVEWQSHKLLQPPHWFEAHARTIIGEQGEPTGIVYVVRDVTEHHLRSIELEVRANTDPLTGLVNRRVFDSALEGSIATAADVPACLALFDLDHFKLVNDRHGHLAGDLVLRRFAGILKACTREQDVTARLGGEEFALILRGAGHDEARAICERIRQQLATTIITTAEGQRLSITVSAGLRMIAPRMTPEELLLEADQALYDAKRAGRNCLKLAA